MLRYQVVVVILQGHLAIRILMIFHHHHHHHPKSSPWPWSPCRGCGNWTLGGSLPSSTCSTHLENVQIVKEYLKKMFEEPEKYWGLLKCEKMLFWWLEFCKDIWKDWDRHFNTKILHFSKAFNPKILEWRHFFNLESFVKLNHLGKFLKEVESDFLWQTPQDENSLNGSSSSWLWECRGLVNLC